MNNYIDHISTLTHLIGSPIATYSENTVTWMGQLGSKGYCVHFDKNGQSWIDGCKLDDKTYYSVCGYFAENNIKYEVS